jgi:hypothetical protein
MTTTERPLLESFYGRPVESAPTGKENFAKFVHILQRRRERAQPITIIIDGRETGVGKSSLAIELARKLDPSFGHDHIVYSAQELFRFYERAQDGSAAIYDESVLGLLSKKGSRDEELSGLIGALSIVRKNGIATFILVPRIAMLDAIVVNGLAPHYLFIEARGRARPHRAHKGAQYRKSRPRIPYDLWEDLYPIGWRNLDGEEFFEAYKAKARERNRAYFAEMEQISLAKKRRLLGIGRGEQLDPVGDNVPKRAVSPPPLQHRPTCPECGDSFTRTDALRRHRASVHAPLASV